MKRKVSIGVRKPDGRTANALHGGKIELGEQPLRWLFGEKKALGIAPGDCAFDVEIRE